MTKISDFSEFYQEEIKALQTLSHAENLFQEEAKALLPLAEKSHDDIDQALDTLHQTHRLFLIQTAKLENHADFKKEYEDLKANTDLLKTWKNYKSPAVDDALNQSLADKLYNVDSSADVVQFMIGDYAKIIGTKMARRMVEDNIPFIMSFLDTNFMNLILKHCTKDDAQNLAQRLMARNESATKQIAAYGNMTDVDVKADPENHKIYTAEHVKAREKGLKGNLHFTITTIPTHKDAKVEGLDYDAYNKLYFEAVDQPWEAIEETQAALIKEFDACKNVRFTNEDGTDISMDIEGFTFCNSVIARNIPGAEIFSAPRRDSANGVIVAKGRHITRYDYQVLEDITMHFKDGKLADYHVAKGQDIFEKILETDEGVSYIGELGIGTNPYLKRHVANILLTEKISGSFHVALGAAYTFEDYLGTPVHVDNGNRSTVHWDITTMLWKKQGKIYLDGRIVMDNGIWLDEKYDILNRGWAAIPRDQRPDYWKDYEGPSE